MNFHDDPQPLISELDLAWEIYTADFEEQIQGVLSSIVSWRWATDDMFPSHPLFGQADTTTCFEPWRPFTRSWLRDEDPKANLDEGWLHGIDENGRIVLARNRNLGKATLWREQGCDRIQIHESPKQPGRFIRGMRYQDREQLTRFWHNVEGQIECMCDYSRGRKTNYRQFEWFEYEGKRCVESLGQSFEIMPEIPHYQREKPDEELRKSYRPLEGVELVGNLVESMIWRRRVKYSYGPSGDLILAEEFRGDGEPVDELLFEKRPERPLDETIESLADSTAKTILKAVRKRAPDKPYRALALIYSAEHAHCGLPHHVRVLGHDTAWPEERFNFEEYPIELDVAFKRPVLKLLTEFNQRCHALFADEAYDSEVEAAIFVMRTLAGKLQQQLSGTKHVGNDFAVFVIDDHGDVDGFAVPGAQS